MYKKDQIVLNENSVMKMNDQNCICRLCLVPTPEQFVSVFKQDLITIIKTYINIEVQELDKYSKWICKQCTVTLNTFHNYVLFVKRNNEYLNGVLSSSLSNGKVETLNENEHCNLNPESERKMEVFVKKSMNENVRENHFFKTEQKSEEVISEEIDNHSDGSESFEEIYKTISNNNDNNTLKKNKCRHERKTYKETSRDIHVKKLYKYECKLCTNHHEFISFRAFRIHYRNEHNTEAYIECCGRRFTAMKDLDRHVDMHLKPNTLVCPECGKQLRTKDTFRTHMDTHVPMERRPYKCQFCEMRFMRKSVMAQHEPIHRTKDQSLEFVCEFCSKRFPTETLMKHHIRKCHKTDKPFICDACAKAFKTKSELANHQYMHNDEGQRQCEKCGAWFRTPRSYLRHMRDKHSDTAPISFPCTYCSHVLLSRTAFYAHILHKHKPKNHKCTMCDKIFSTPILLKNHLEKHNGPGAPVQCNHCPKLFRNIRNLRRHQRNKHDER